jgi:hypothetical protein
MVRHRVVAPVLAGSTPAGHPRKESEMARIKLNDTSMDALVKMAEGNPGAVVAMTEIMKKHNEIDPQAAMGGLGAILLLDTWEIYGTDIYILYNNKCNRDIRKMLMLMRAVQLGYFPETRLKEMAHDQMMRINLTDEEWKALNEKVCNRLSEFAKK